MSRGLLPFRLSICGVRELPDFATRGVSHVLSILDPYTPTPAAFAAFRPHRRQDMRFHDAIAGDDLNMPLPQDDDVAAVLAFGRSLAREKVDHLLVHCFAGVSRSTASAVMLMAQDNPGREAECFAVLHDIRPKCWPNSVMIGIADRLLGRKGRLIEAMRGHHREVAGRHPDVVELIRSVGRNHEVVT